MEDIVLGTGPFHTPEDEKILRVARELASQLDISATGPTKISWADRIGLMKIPFDQAFFPPLNEMILPKALMGKLEPEEWRPIIASSFILHRKIRRKSELGFAVRMGLPIIPIMIMMLLVFPALGERPPLFLTAAFIVGLVSVYLALTALASSSSWKHMKRMALKADSESAKYVSRERFLEVLRKLDSLGLEEKGFRAHLQPRPTVGDRIRNLESSR